MTLPATKAGNARRTPSPEPHTAPTAAHVTGSASGSRKRRASDDMDFEQAAPKRPGGTAPLSPRAGHPSNAGLNEAASAQHTPGAASPFDAVEVLMISLAQMSLPGAKAAPSEVDSLVDSLSNLALLGRKTAPHQLSELDAQVAQHVMGRLECLRLVVANPAAAYEMTSAQLREVNPYFVQERAMNVRSLADFHAVLGAPGAPLAEGLAQSVRSLPPAQRVAALEVLGHRVKTLENPKEFIAACVAFRHAVIELPAALRTNQRPAPHKASLAELDGGLEAVAIKVRQAQNNTGTMRDVGDLGGYVEVIEAFKKALIPIEEKAVEYACAYLRAENKCTLQKVVNKFGITNTIEIQKLDIIIDSQEAIALCSNGYGYGYGYFDKKFKKIIETEMASGKGATEIALERGAYRPEGIFKVEEIAINLHAEKFQSHQTALEIASALGITTPHGIECLEKIITDKFAAGKVRVGQNVAAVAEQHGITTAGGLRYLEANALSDFSQIKKAVIQGANVKHLVAAQGITHPHTIRQLEQLAVGNETTARRLVKNRESVVAVTQNLGIQDQRLITGMETLVITELGLGALEKGMTTDDFSRQHGITTPGGLRQLKTLAKTLGSGI
jgi:hypothetical protein